MSKEMSNYEKEDVGKLIVLADAAINAGFNEIKLDSQYAFDIANLAYDYFELSENNKRLREFVKKVSELDICTLFYENQWAYLDYIEYVDPEITEKAADLIKELDNES